MKTDAKLLWVEVTKDYVYLKDGPEMPDPVKGTFYGMMFGNTSAFKRAEFARWSGVAFQKGDGIYGLRCPLAVIERYRSVEEKTYVAAEKTTRRLVRV